MWDRKHFLTLYDLSRDDILRLVERGLDLKKKHESGSLPTLLEGYSLAMVFRKPSLRTRMSFEMAMVGLGGHALYVSDEEIKLGRREAVCDVARVVSRYVDIIMIRTFEQGEVEELARYASVPVINGLTDLYHPCQILGDILTIVEKKGKIEGLKVAYIGDGNNIAHSWINAASKLDFTLSLGLAKGYEPDSSILERARQDGAKIEISYDPHQAVKDADVIYTDVWASMGKEAERERRMRDLGHLQVNSDLVKSASPQAIVMHCLPAHRGEEITDEVIDSTQSVVYDEAENRMHIQRAIILELVGK